MSCWLAMPRAASSFDARAASFSGRHRDSDEEHRRLVPVGQGLDGLFIQFFPRFQARQLAQTGRAVFALLDELAPRRRQLQHAQGVACRRRIEDDVVVATGNGFIGEEIGELVEGGDFYGTRTGQLFFHVAQAASGRRPR